MSVVTLSSDIGFQDYIIAAFKGQIISQNSQALLVDINHELNATNYPHAAFICSQAYSYFPKGTIHVLLIDCFEGNNEQFLLIKHNDQFIICPDNGIATMLVPSPKFVYSIPLSTHFSILHITQQLALVIHQLLCNVLPEDFLKNATNFQQKIALQPLVGSNWIEGQILMIDKFDNVIVNITRQQFEEAAAGRPFEISVPHSSGINKISNHYSEVPKGEVLAMFNAANYLELAVNNGKMAALFGLRSFSTRNVSTGSVTSNTLFYQTIRIYFLNK
jgi:S-adenosylmethionine hydrolase